MKKNKYLGKISLKVMRYAIIFILIIMLNAGLCNAKGGKIKMIKLVWLNFDDEKLEEYLSNLLKIRLNTNIQSYYEKELPINSYSKLRRQYKAEEFIKMLSKYKEERCIVLGIVNEDLYVESLNFVFGLANPYEKIAVIALVRLRQEFYMLKSDANLFYKRAGKEAVHEIGHLIGLSHCKEIKCVMHFSNSLQDTDIKEDNFCKECRKRVNKYLNIE